MKKENGIAYCGLACCVCGERDNCVGCRNGGCKVMEWCGAWKCCMGKGINGCFECDDFPCDNPMLKKTRIRAFARFAKEYGIERLMNALEYYEKKGVVYHYEGEHIGDYDKIGGEQEIIDYLLQAGK